MAPTIRYQEEEQSETDYTSCPDICFAQLPNGQYIPSCALVYDNGEPVHSSALLAISEGPTMLPCGTPIASASQTFYYSTPYPGQQQQQQQMCSFPSLQPNYTLALAHPSCTPGGVQSPALETFSSPLVSINTSIPPPNLIQFEMVQGLRNQQQYSGVTFGSPATTAMTMLPETFNYPTMSPQQPPLMTSFGANHLEDGCADFQHLCMDPISLSMRMDLVWNYYFNVFFQQFKLLGHQWRLSVAENEPSGEWRVIQDVAKVRFLCRVCSNGWTSMKGRVIFYVSANQCTGEGEVVFKLFGQVCKKCLDKDKRAASGRFQHSMWYPEEVIKVLKNLQQDIGEMFYNWPSQPREKKTGRNGKPRFPHNSDLCQACKEGICTLLTMHNAEKSVGY